MLINDGSVPSSLSKFDFVDACISTSWRPNTYNRSGEMPAVPR
jgi:hypothetical protein